MDANVTFRMDSQVKSEMTAICNQLGITTSAAFNISAMRLCGARECRSLSL